MEIALSIAAFKETEFCNLQFGLIYSIHFRVKKFDFEIWDLIEM